VEAFNNIKQNKAYDEISSSKQKFTEECPALCHAGRLRHRVYRGRLYALVRLWRNSGNTAMETAADALVRVFQLYTVNTSAQIDAESRHQSMKSIDGNQPMKSTEINN
jgi:hypothetical protein